MSLTDDAVKKRLIQLANEGCSDTEISRMTGIPRATIYDFLNKRTHKGWWNEGFYGIVDNGAINDDGPNILITDIETSPNLCYTWGLFNQNIAINQVHTNWEILCAGYKWLGEDKTHMLTAQEYWTANNPEAMEDMILSLWALFDNADILVAHNGRRFDNKKIKTKFKEWGLPKPSPYKVVDTLSIAKQQFGFLSNKQEYISQMLGGDGKLQTGGMKLWIDCLAGDSAAWDQMHDYCEMDIQELERMYLEFRGWDNQHPNVQLYYNDDLDRCGVCGSTSVEPINERYAFTGQSKFPLVRCRDCGGIRRGKQNLRTKGQMRRTTVNVV